jgi:ElaB/YqjD/DUF883 family membrane-anchored ribosome-binding protein
VRKTTALVALATVALTLTGCSEGDLRDLARDTQQALRNAGDALEELAVAAEGPLRETADRALEAAQEARAASEDFRTNPTTETRQALELANRRLDNVSNELEGLVDGAPESVRSALRRALDALTDLRHRIDRELESS